MNRPRQRPDGLPYRVYERRGARVYSIGHKATSGAWSFRWSCAAIDKKKITELRRAAIAKAAGLALGAPALDTFAALCEAWLANQEAKPLGAEGRRAESTLAENRREIANLKKAFGHQRVQDMEKPDAYAYLDAAERARAPDGKLRPRPEKANKEIALARTILEYGIRTGKLKANPFDGVAKLVTVRKARLVTDAELDLALRVGRALGGPRLICALALKAAWLCVRRSVEVRALSAAQLTDAGIVWAAAKRRRGSVQRHALIEWSPELRATIDEALAVPRHKDAGEWYVFGNLKGERYTKGGWKSTLDALMTACVAKAERDGIAFKPFSLQDCRPKGVTDKLARGDVDVMDATLHTDERMMQQVYDRRRVRVAKPVK